MSYMKNIFADNLPGLTGIKGMPRRSMPEPLPLAATPSLSKASKLLKM